MLGDRLGACGGDMLPVVTDGADQHIIVEPADTQDGDVDRSKLSRSEMKRIPVFILGLMLDPLLVKRASISGCGAEFGKGPMFQVHALKCFVPEVGVTEAVPLTRLPADQSQPLQVVRDEHAALKRHGLSDNRRSSRSDGAKMRRSLTCGVPLGSRTVRAAPHDDVPVTPLLGSKPFHDVMPIRTKVSKRLEDAIRGSSATNVDNRDIEAVACKVPSAVVIRIRYVWRKNEHGRMQTGGV